MAQKIFVIDDDYDKIIKDSVLDTILAENRALLRKQEQVAITEMIGLLNARFDVTNIFPALQEWTSRMLYSPGMYVSYRGTFYRALPVEDEAAANRNQVPGAENSPYWTDDTFPNIKDWDDQLVPAGAYRLRSGIFYRCMVEHANQDPAEAANAYDYDMETGFWIVDDPRDAKLVEICCEMAAYKVHARISPDQIPQLRIDHYDMALDFLKDIAAGKRDPLLPRLSEDEANRNTVQFGSVKRRNWTYGFGNESPRTKYPT